MSKTVPTLALLLAASGTWTGTVSPLTAQAPEAAGEQQEPTAVERGEYLVHHVAMCVECHTPRTSTGAIVERQLLMGAPIPLRSPYPQQTWAFQAPQIAGLPGWTDEEIVTLLVTGARPDGRSPRPPMPEFHLKPADARAVVAYLRSLAP